MRSRVTAGVNPGVMGVLRVDNKNQEKLNELNSIFDELYSNMEDLREPITNLFIKEIPNEYFDSVKWRLTLAKKQIKAMEKIILKLER